MPMGHRRGERSGESGQALVIFVIALVVIIGMTGLIVDGGSAFVQRRAEQNAADAAAMAGATAYLATLGTVGAKQAAAQQFASRTAAANGYPDVSVTFPRANEIAVTVNGTHTNYFSGLLGQSSWPVTASASAQAGVPNAAMNAMPILFNEKAFVAGLPIAREAPGEFFQPPAQPNPCPTKDVPCDATTFNWTVFCMAQSGCVGNTSDVAGYIRQQGYDTTVTVGADIGPLNAGKHTDLYEEVKVWEGEEFPVGIVDDEGNLVGWALFHISYADKGAKAIQGYFVGPVESNDLMIVNSGSAGKDFGAYAIRLTD